ncbi:MAG: retropepsin-like aspartic protease [Isosphaeraceae bacterium]
MRFSYLEREVDPLPGIPGSDREWEPQITVRVGGATSLQIVPGLVDTGASITLIPLRYLERLGIEPLGTITLSTVGGPITVRLARVDLELHSSRTIHAWSALVGFAARRERALWGRSASLNTSWQRSTHNVTT